MTYDDLVDLNRRLIGDDAAALVEAQRQANSMLIQERQQGEIKTFMGYPIEEIVKLVWEHK